MTRYYTNNSTTLTGTFVSSGSDHATLVFVCLGVTSFDNYQKYIWLALRQARLIAPTLHIVVISHANQSSIVYKQLRELNTTFVAYEDLLKHSGILLVEFHRTFFVQGNMEPDGNRMFVQHTSERLLVLHAYMNATNTLDVFHIENDNMLYIDPNELIARFYACDVKFAIPKAAEHTAVTSFLYARSAVEIEHFVRFMIEVFRLGRKKAIDFLNTSWINDMTIAGRYLDLYAMNDSQSRESGIFELPTQFSGDFCLNKARKEPFIIFDACVLGQYYGGRFSVPGIPYWESSRLVDPRGQILDWRRYTGSFRVPFIRELRIVNLHVHSKVLTSFESNRDDQPTGKPSNRTLPKL